MAENCKFEDDCEHDFIDIQNTTICELCGLESIETNMAIKQYKMSINFDYSKYVINQYSLYIDNISESLRAPIIYKFETLCSKYTTRGESKCALMAACYFFVLKNANVVITAQEVCTLFNITRKKFSIARTKYLQVYPSEDVKKFTISQYTLLIFNKFKFPMQYYDIILEYCSNLDNNKTLINSNPCSVCACMVYKILSLNKIITLKKNVFVKQIGMSDLTIQNVFKLLENYNLEL